MIRSIPDVTRPAPGHPRGSKVQIAHLSPKCRGSKQGSPKYIRSPSPDVTESVRIRFRLGNRQDPTLTGVGFQRTLEIIDLPNRSLSKEAAKAMVREVAEG